MTKPITSCILYWETAKQATFYDGYSMLLRLPKIVPCHEVKVS